MGGSAVGASAVGASAVGSSTIGASVVGASAIGSAGGLSASITMGPSTTAPRHRTAITSTPRMNPVQLNPFFGGV